jgi:hypothetical protein
MFVDDSGCVFVFPCPRLCVSALHHWQPLFVTSFLNKVFSQVQSLLFSTRVWTTARRKIELRLALIALSIAFWFWSAMFDLPVEDTCFVNSILVCKVHLLVEDTCVVSVDTSRTFIGRILMWLPVEYWCGNLFSCVDPSQRLCLWIFTSDIRHFRKDFVVWWEKMKVGRCFA